MVTTKCSLTLVAAAAISLGSHAEAQTIQGGWEIRVSNVVSPSQPSATIEVWAWFDTVPGVSELFAGGDYDLTAGEAGWLWSPWVFPLHSPGPGVTIRGNSIIGLFPGQLHIPTLGIYGNPSNPIHVFSADWATSDFTPRTVSIITENTSIFAVYSQAGVSTTLSASAVVPGSGTIFVVPAPASLTALAIAFATCSTTRRRLRA